jgi:hypothetical protein
MTLYIKNMVFSERKCETVYSQPFSLIPYWGWRLDILMRNRGSSSDLKSKEQIIDMVLKSILLPLHKTQGFWIGI